ncbi:hypothetical protein BGZ65_011991 [Modicella reniformis]|uniref:MYND-type domain-containing protein n=1 Tax=Modicella reniformis TaxID=1440133 RepID=A0A9P6MAJ0_9FUNG|nr:hypothetical protein BGZ65_011991 [Modicella reniformis]
MAKSPTSLMASLSASVALYDNQQPPKSLQDILLLAQSHYISHRYVPALTLYKLAAERHHSLPACSSLFALYTSTANAPGHGSMRSKTQDEYDELEEYFVHRQRNPCKAKHGSSSIPVHKPVKNAKRTEHPAIAHSFESEYRTPLHLRSQEGESVDHQSEGGEDNRTEDDNEENNESEDDDDDDDGEEEEDEEEDSGCGECSECDEVDEEHEKEEEARRIGLATTEIEDIVQKLCLMIQKGVLGLDEPIMMDAVSILRKIERGLSQEAIAWKQELSRSKSLFISTLSGGGNRSDEVNSIGPDLLLTQGIDLSFLNFSPDEDAPIVQAQPTRRSGRQVAKPAAITTTGLKNSPVNAAISNLPTVEQERGQDMCRAIRIRGMYTLGWVHQQKGEYHYGAQAYGVCSEIATTGKRPLNSLQQQALVQQQVCRDLEIKAKEQAVLESMRLQERKQVESKNADPKRTPPSTKGSNSSYGSSFYTTAEASTSGHPEISSPSSVASSESGISVLRGPSGAISSLSAVFGFRTGSYRSVAASVTESQDAPKTPMPKLQRSKSLLLGPKSKSLETPTTVEIKDSHHNHHHRPRAQHRTKSSHHQQQQLRQQSMPILTMAAHQKNAVKCGYCGQSRILMPLCVCKKVRYCNGECRLADLNTHQLTGCHAARIGIRAVANVHSSATPGVAL